MKMVYEYICFIKVVKTYHELKLVICFLIRLKKNMFKRWVFNKFTV